MKLTIYQVDAFSKKLFKGNPAAVVPLQEWLPEELMQNIALENNLSETAFFVKTGDRFHIRWFTPKIEVPLCGHATLASSFVIFNYLEAHLNELRFDSKSGELIITREGEFISLNFPALKPGALIPSEKIYNVMPIQPSELLYNDSYFAVFDDEEIVRNYKPDLKLLAEFEDHGLIVTSRAKDYDFISRFFVPGSGIDEDPVTGYAHTLLTPYWSEKLGKKQMHAYQASDRGGELLVEDLNGRVKITGSAVLYMKGEIEI